MERIDPSLRKNIELYGKGNWNECYHCGTCTAVCKHTEEQFLLPRKTIRQIQTGFKQKIEHSVEPWLCYYCGDCSDSCPRDANPGELMMAARRYLTGRYDWTGLSRLFYTSFPMLVVSFLLIAVIIFGFAYVHDFSLGFLLEFGHKFEVYAIIGVALLFLLPNILRMLWYQLGHERSRISGWSLIKAIWTVPAHMFTQMATLKCQDNFRRWFLHLLLVIGYLSLLIITVFFNWFSSQNNLVIILGYGVGAVTFAITFIYIIGRIRKKTQLSKFSHYTDWLFVVWLFMMGLTAFLVRAFIDLNILEQHVWIYMVHLIILSQWALIIVPFGKWSHFLYRSFAMYSYQVLKESKSKYSTQVNLSTI